MKTTPIAKKKKNAEIKEEELLLMEKRIQKNGDARYNGYTCAYIGELKNPNPLMGHDSTS